MFLALICSQLARIWRFRSSALEARTQAREPTIFRYGWVTPLPEDFTGERHTVIVMREATGSSNTEWCHFEERPGPVP
jgi:hypothetical protein